MKLIDFPYTTTHRLVKYSKLVTKAIASFNRDYASTNWDYTSIDRNSASKIGTIAHDPNYGLPPNEDRLDYWDSSSNIITYGRYLLFTRNKQNSENKEEREEIPFWTGLSSTQAKIEFIIWFKQQQPGNVKEKKIPMENADFEKFCNINSSAHCITNNSCAYCRRQIVKTFWYKVLGALK